MPSRVSSTQPPWPLSLSSDLALLPPVMSTVGFGDMSAHNSWERFITTWIMLIGVAVYTVMLGAVTALLSAARVGRTRGLGVT